MNVLLMELHLFATYHDGNKLSRNEINKAEVTLQRKTEVKILL